MPPWPIPRCLSRCSTAPTPAAMSTPIAAIPPPNGSETETGRLACAYPAQRQRHQGHLRYTKEAQPPYRHAARPCRTRVRRADANGRQAGAMHGYRPRHLRLAAQGGKLQPKTAGVPEGRRIGTVLNDPRRYEPPADRQVYSCATSFPCIPPRPIRPPKFVIGSLRNSSRRQKQVIRGRLKPTMDRNPLRQKGIIRSHHSFVDLISTITHHPFREQLTTKDGKYVSAEQLENRYRKTPCPSIASCPSPWHADHQTE